MSLVQIALRRPYTVLVLLFALAVGAWFSWREMARDIFPSLGVPTIYVAQPYGGMDPAQMEGFLTYYYEYHFLYITGIEHVESKSIQGAALVKLQFYPGTDMAQAMSETVSYVNRARAFMPPGTVPPFVMRFDAGSVPVGYLAFASASKSVGQIQDLALNTVRPLFATLQGVSAPPPFGGSPRTIVVDVEPDRLQTYGLSAQDVVTAISNAETISPSGNINLKGLYPAVPVNSIVKDVKDLAAVAVRTGVFPTVFIRDVARVSDASDVPTSIALVNGKPTVYIPVTKRADASTLSVVNLVKENLPKFQAVLPDDVRVTYVFDQSPYVTRAIASLTTEGALGALLAGVMVLLFLRDWRSALIVVVNIPLSLFAALFALWLTGQTVNIMTLGGLVLAVGILVDMSTVAIENIHTHLARTRDVARAVLDSGREVAVPLLIAMLCVVAVFLPSFAMQGTAKALFVPLSLAVGFSMAFSYILANTLVPILSIWAFRTRHASEAANHGAPGAFERFQTRYARRLTPLVAHRGWVTLGYVIACAVLIVLIVPRLGTDIFPRTESRQLQLRIRAPAGTQIAETAVDTQNALKIIAEEAGPDSVELSLSLVGVHASAYPINLIHLWNSGPQESVLQVQLKDSTRIAMSPLRARLRQRFAKDMPDVQFSFEPADIISRVMSFGASTPIEISVAGVSLADDRAFAEKVRSKIKTVTALRDVQFGQPLDYPSLNVAIDRERAGVLGVTANDLARSLAPVTSSSRFTQPVYWAAANGVGFQVQVQVPQPLVTSIEDVRNASVSGDRVRTLLRNVATVQQGTIVGEYDRYNMTRMVTVTANIEGTDLGSAATAVRTALQQLGAAPPKVSIAIRGQVQSMDQLLNALQFGLLLSVFVVFLLLVANFQSWQLALVTVASLPAVIAGVAIVLWLWRSTLNLESFMGAIMAVGVAVANAILLVTFAERARMEGKTAAVAAIEGASSRLRPILMTSLAMMAGMLPMALGVGESGQQTAPLGRAVIGGLALATLATLWVIPAVFALVRSKAGRRSPSLDPDDPLAAVTPS
jgi:multidrug efflux pump subunit AcrB